MALFLSSRGGLALLRSLLKLKPNAPSLANSLIPYACWMANPLLLNMNDRQAEERVLRGNLLAPRERAEDLNLWADDNPTRTWLRRYWLTSNYRGTPRYHAAAAAMSDPAILPTLTTTKKIFSMKEWKFRGTAAAGGDVIGPDSGADERRRLAAIAKIETANGALDGLETLEILEAAGCALGGRSTFNAWCEAHGVFEFLTHEYVAALAKHIRSLNLPAGSVVLELGSGSGRLAHFLRRELVGSKLRVVATDSGGWNLKRKDNLGAGAEAVETLNYEQALKKYQPNVVITAWMPMGVDWSAAIRGTASVQEYLLVGEADDGCCGHNWFTWGNPDFFVRASPLRARAENSKEPAPDSSDHQQAPYQADGWTRQDLPAVSAHQLSRFDSEDFVGNSCTVAFRRK